jgi:hypothetical protein
VSYFAKFLDDPKELLTLILAAAGGTFALWRWTIDQRWRRVLHAQSLIEKFFAKQNTIEACKILDVVDEEVEFEFPDKSKKPIKLTNAFLIGALSTFDQKELNDEGELVVRGILSNFFDDLSDFQNHIDARLIKRKDVKPYLEYWFQELTGTGRVHDEPKFGVQVAKYLKYFGYKKVLRLATRLGHPFPKEPSNAPRTLVSHPSRTGQSSPGSNQ